MPDLSTRAISPLITSLTIPREGCCDSPHCVDEEIRTQSCHVTSIQSQIVTAEPGFEPRCVQSLLSESLVSVSSSLKVVDKVLTTSKTTSSISMSKKKPSRKRQDWSREVLRSSLPPPGQGPLLSRLLRLSLERPDHSYLIRAQLRAPQPRASTHRFQRGLAELHRRD